MKTLKSKKGLETKFIALILTIGILVLMLVMLLVFKPRLMEVVGAMKERLVFWR